MVIIAPDGRSLLDRVVEPMSVAQVRWFCDPVAFLENIPHLWALKLRVFCLRCWKRGVKDEVRVRWDDTNGAFLVACNCSRVEAKLPVASVTYFASSTDELIAKLGWSLCCTGRCAKESRFADGVEAGNDPAGHVVTITCGCTERRHVMPPSAGVVQ